MRIALISYEFPPAVAVGGIGTYAWEASRMLAGAGCDVEVFAAGSNRVEPAEAFGVKVHRFEVADRATFRVAISRVFADRHRYRSFDVLESPEIGAEGAIVAAAHPNVARVVKLHTPSYVVEEINWNYPTLFERLRFSMGGLKRGKLAMLYKPTYDAKKDIEREWTRSADEIAAPSKAIREKLIKDWKLNPNRISWFPLPFLPSEELLNVHCPQSVMTVGFLGRLEVRKGVTDFAFAIPHILRKAPRTRFRLIGPTWPYRKSDMEAWIRSTFPRYLNSIDFVGEIPRTELASEIAKCDVMAFPSRWESFGLVCPEAMAAGRAVIGSSVGGMSEVIENGRSGILVPPRNARAIAEAVLSLSNDLNRMTDIAEEGRKRVLEFLSPSRIISLQLASYENAIERCRERMR